VNKYTTLPKPVASTEAVGCGARFNCPATA